MFKKNVKYSKRALLSSKDNHCFPKKKGAFLTHKTTIANCIGHSKMKITVKPNLTLLQKTGQ